MEGPDSYSDLSVRVSVVTSDLWNIRFGITRSFWPIFSSVIDGRPLSIRSPLWRNTDIVIHSQGTSVRMAVLTETGPGKCDVQVRSTREGSRKVDNSVSSRGNKDWVCMDNKFFSRRFEVWFYVVLRFFYECSFTHVLRPRFPFLFYSSGKLERITDSGRRRSSAYNQEERKRWSFQSLR